MDKIIEFDMNKYVHELCGFVRGENKLGDTMDLANNNEADSHNDRIADIADVEHEIIMTEAKRIMEDDDSVEQLIVNNADVVWSIIKSKSDVEIKLVEIKLNESLRHWAYCDAEDALK